MQRSWLTQDKYIIHAKHTNLLLKMKENTFDDI